MEGRREGGGEEGTLIKDQSREERKRENVCVWGGVKGWGNGKEGGESEG